MDILTLLGITIGIGAILLGNALEGGAISFLFQPVSFLIVFGGTIGATMAQSCYSAFKRAIIILPWTLFHKNAYCELKPVDVTNWSKVWREGGPAALEEFAAEHTKDPFIQRALELLVEGHPAETLEATLEIELEEIHHEDMVAVQVYESMGGYSPTIGLIGAILGLIQVMQNITDPDQLGSGISTAFIATIYGLGLANILYIPIAKKLETLVNLRARHHEMITAAVVAMAHKENPRYITSRLSAYLSHDAIYSIGEDLPAKTKSKPINKDKPATGQ